MEILLTALAVVLMIIGFLYALATGKLEKKTRKERAKKEETDGLRRDKWNTFRRFEDVYSSIEEVQGFTSSILSIFCFSSSLSLDFV